MKYQTYTIFSDWTPTVEAINALPEPLRRYIMNLETRCDPAGETRERILVAEENAMLRKKLADIMPPHFEEFQRQLDELADSFDSRCSGSAARQSVAGHECTDASAARHPKAELFYRQDVFVSSGDAGQLVKGDGAALTPLPFQAALAKCRAEAEGLRDAVRLMIGRAAGMYWQDVPQSEVDYYLAKIMELKAKKPS